VTQVVPTVAKQYKSKRARAIELMIKRDTHNDSERQRRNEMKEGLMMLKDALPPVEGMERMNTSQLLEYAILHVHAMAEEDQRLLAEKEALRLEIARKLSARA